MTAFFIVIAASAIKTYAFVLVLDPGHGGPGSTGLGCTYPPYSEKGLTLDVANKLKAELSDIPGLTVYLTRTGDNYMSLEERAFFAKSVNADFLISLHFNSSGPHDKTGTEIWTSAFGSNFTTGAALGQLILQQYTAMGLESKGVKTKLGDRGDYYGIIRHATSMGIPTIILEHCFLDNPTDRAVLEAQGTQGFAHADATAIYSFLNSNYGLTRGQPAAENKNDAKKNAKNGGNNETKTEGAEQAPEAAQASAPADTSAIVSQTKYGFPIDGAGNVYYTDPAGAKLTISSGNWNWLLGKWAYTQDAEFNLKSLPVKDIEALIQKHASGEM